MQGWRNAGMPLRPSPARSPASPTSAAAAPWHAALWRRLARRPAVSVEVLVLLASAAWALGANLPFLRAALQGRDPGDAAAWGFGAALVVMLLALHTLLLALLCSRWTVKPVLALLTVAAAVALFYMQAFGIYLDPTMLRNLLRTHPAEARELLSPALVLHMAVYAGLPLALLAWVRVSPRRWSRALPLRGALLLGAAAVLLGAGLAVFQPLSSLMRNQRALRYLVTPANLVWSAGAVVAADARGAARPREPIGLDAAPGPSWAARRRPLLLVLVVGETARAANWGLNAGAPGLSPRATTPELARALAQSQGSAGAAGHGRLVNFASVQSCGTNTETSLPCMFAPVGRRDYDEARIRGQQSLLHVLARAGVQVHWRDNQSGCKGVCDGLPADSVQPADAPALCNDGRCLDEALLLDLDRRLENAQGTQLLVLHMIGSHGPSYFRRYPAAFARFQPDCREDDLRRCSVEQVVNAYDNSLLYTDHVLAGAIARLQARAGTVDSALLYVSDHGESLGEHGLFLHGLPFAIAPDVQTRVPMLAWTSPGLERAAGLPEGCLQPAWQRLQAAPLAHDHLFHTVLGLLDVRTALHAPALDLTQGCRMADAALASAAGTTPGATAVAHP
ncbi:phosphoethanolamine transferase [Rubrivivax sp. RP6-9]|uniref:phosphoethanolamine transferase n=1 Tax=Rubrivivax sp. RP6-9 TaxID=3415750 RepID=UPI003CC57451